VNRRDSILVCRRDGGEASGRRQAEVLSPRATAATRFEIPGVLAAGS
jgi:hypothetical protein